MIASQLRQTAASAIAAIALAFSAGIPAPALGAEQAVNPLSAVVGVRAVVPSEARTADALGTLREGSGVVIDSDGLVLTIGYLILEASEATVTGPDGTTVAADIVAYDSETGFGLLRARPPVKVSPMLLGDSSTLASDQPVLVAGHGGPNAVRPAIVVDRREFAGYWEYLLEDAIFTSPPHPAFGGAALIDRDGRLVGIGSLIVADARPEPDPLPGNMFVPIERLKPILADLLTEGHGSQSGRPWLGIFTREMDGHLFVTRVSPEGPGEAAGIEPGDVIAGVAGTPVADMAAFYRSVWALGAPGVAVPINVLRGVEVVTITVESADRYHWYRTGTTY